MEKVLCMCRNPTCREGRTFERTSFTRMDEPCTTEAAVELKEIHSGKIEVFCVYCAESRLQLMTHGEV